MSEITIVKDKKPTKIERFLEIRRLLVEIGVPFQLLDFIDGEIELLQKKQAAAAERGNHREEKNESITNEIYTLMPFDREVTVDEIVRSFNMRRGFDEEELTNNKIISRIAILVNQGRIIKKQKRIDGVRKMVYIKPSPQSEHNNNNNDNDTE